MKLTESIESKLATVYHSSGDVNCFKYILNHDWRDGDVGHAYGHGLYTCWSFDSTFYSKNSVGNSIMNKEFYMRKDIDSGRASIDSNSGEYICFRFEFLVDLTNYFFCAEPNDTKKTQVVFEKYKIVHPESTATVDTFMDEQNKRFGTNYKDKWDIVQDRRLGKNVVDGILFIGNNDGDVVVVYNTDKAIPTKFSKGDPNEWFPINNDKDYAEKAKLAALGISTPESFWDKFEFSDEAKSIIQSLGDANQMNYLISGGNTIDIEDSVEENIETPDNFIDGNKKKLSIKNCFELKTLNIKIDNKADGLTSLSLMIENEADSDLSEIKINDKSTDYLEISDSYGFVINRCPNLHLSNIVASSGQPNSLFKLRLTSVDEISVSEYDDVKLINAKINFAYIAECKNVLIKNMHLAKLILSGKQNVVLKNAQIDNIIYEDGANKNCINADDLSNF